MDSKQVFASTSFPVLRIVKSWAGAWEQGYAPLICGRGVKYVISRMLLRRLDEVSQLPHEIGHLLYEAGHSGGLTSDMSEHKKQHLMIFMRTLLTTTIRQCQVRTWNTKLATVGLYEPVIRLMTSSNVPKSILTYY